jgi:hypothetical protein
MADQPDSPPPAGSRPTRKHVARTQTPGHKETADERRARQREAVITTQIDLKREAADR